MNNFGEKANFIFGIADLIRDTFNRGKYRDVILPFTVLRRIDYVLEPTKKQVLEEYEQFKDRFQRMLWAICCGKRQSMPSTILQSLHLSRY
jgi:type I restriction enzyme M protein